MPSLATVERFIARVEANAHAEACAEFHTEQSTMQENQNPPRVGRDAHVAAEREIMARARQVTSRCIRPVLINGDHVVIRWVFEFTWMDGRTTRMEELVWQRWEGEQIAAETFFYDPAQRAPRSPAVGEARGEQAGAAPAP